MVRTASRIATHLGVSPLIIGLTIVAFGTGSPELAVSVEASLSGDSGLALGNVLGGNICNTLLVLGCCALVSPITLNIELIKMEAPFVAMVTFAVLLMALDQELSRFEGSLLLILLLLYTFFLISRSKQESGEVQEQYAREYGRKAPEYNIWRQALGFICALAGLTLGSHFVVTSATELARLAGISDFVIGISVVAVGTSLPELMASISAVRAGERDLAVGNVIGSNLFNLLMVLGSSALISPLEVSDAVLAFDLPVAVISATCCVPIFFDLKIDRVEGSLMLLSYCCYIAYSVAEGVHYEHTPLIALLSLGLLAPYLCVVSLQILRAMQKSS